MTVTTEQIVEAGARALCEAQNPGDSWRDFDGSSYQAWLKGCTTAALTAMLPLIRKQLADEVRGQCFTSEGAKFAIRQGRSVREIQEFDAALEFAASLIEEVES